jgi:hypothetical protein
MATKEENAAIAAAMQEHILGYQASGLSVREYCQQNDISIERFNYWLYKRSKRSTSQGQGFSLVIPQTTGRSSSLGSSRQPSVQVTLANGTRIDFFEPNAVDLFKVLL